LIVPEEELDTPRMRLLLEVIGSGDFARRVASLGGYDTSETGAVGPVLGAATAQ